VDYEVCENDTNMFHSHPYSIAKIMGHSMVEFYQNTYGLPFSNGIIFTTESSLKKPIFLLNKVSAHIKDWISGNKTALNVGNLDSYRNMLHASDVASAINTIISQKKGDTYLICNTETHKIYDLVIKLYSMSGLELELKENILYEKTSGLEVVIIQNKQLGFDFRPTNIRGEPNKLKKLGWTPSVSIDNILSELLE
jgi:GDP-D-mannose dehydratase